MDSGDIAYIIFSIILLLIVIIGIIIGEIILEYLFIASGVAYIIY
jgi:hypothetical protein